MHRIAVRGRLLVLRALFAGMVGDLPVVRPLLEEGRRLLPDDEASDRALVATAGTFAAMADGSVEGLAYAAILRADLALVVGDLESAERSCGSPRTCSTLRGEEDLLGPVLSVAGLVLFARGDVRGGRRAVLDGAADNRRGGSPVGHRLLAGGARGGGPGRRAPRRGGTGTRVRGRRCPARLASPLWPVLTPLVDGLTAGRAERAGQRAADAPRRGPRVRPPEGPGPDAGRARRPARTPRQTRRPAAARRATRPGATVAATVSHRPAVISSRSTWLRSRAANASTARAAS